MNLIHEYAKIIVNHPFLVIVFALLISVGSFSIYDRLIVDNPNVDEILPDTFSVVDGIQKLSDNLGGGESTAFMIVVELDPELGSNIYDIRDPEVVRYTNILSNQVVGIQDVTGSDSLGNNIYNLNDDKPINNLKDVKELMNDNSNTFDRIVNDKYTLTIIRVYANQGFEVGELQTQVQKIIDNTQKPQGIKVQLAGEAIAGKISEDLTGPDSSKTTMISLFAIIAILLLTFRHPIYTVLPLFTIIFGVIWVFGFIAAAGIKMTNFSSGAISMIIGIGIDFGIQTIMRFKQELASAKPVLAMQKTMENVLKPMFITTIASFIGFWSMTYGDFIILGELGKIMAFGVIFCFLAAITVVPAISVLYELHKPKKKLNSPFKIIKKLFMLAKGNANLK
ncbi:MAG: MMPL family transporter [Candidatus Woesearchaeota archaeon]|jgi:predicted RND superfamily exporter protein|nr:MMPL family transporter [Candidatus Woesearchaeota archaeon]